MATLEEARRTRVDRWLDAGGTVLASSARTARALAAAHHDARREEGRTAWTSPAILSWDEWVHARWAEQNPTGLLTMNSLQEESVWAQAIRSRPGIAGVDRDPARGVGRFARLARSAREAYALLAGYAPGKLQGAVGVAPARLGWTGDAAVFAEWLAEFESRCRRDGLISASRVSMELARVLNSADTASGALRAPLLLAGFDRLQSAQTLVLEAWGNWQLDEPEAQAAPAKFYSAADAAHEVEACVQWLVERTLANPHGRLLVLATGLAARRGQLERALLDASVSAPRSDAAGQSDAGLAFEFSLGVPLAGVGIVRAALLLLCWLHAPLGEADLDWLFGSGHVAGSQEEEVALAETMLRIRGNGQQSPEWALEDFCAPGNAALAPPGPWIERINRTRKLLADAPLLTSPMEWVGVVDGLLSEAGWPGFRPVSSIDYQAIERWQQTLEQCASLGFNGVPMSWVEFVETVSSAVEDTIFAVESSDAPIQITEPVTSAGLLADGTWFLGADAAAWPGRGEPHPLLPIALQRESSMPHANHSADWAIAQQATTRIASSAGEVIFSYARQAGEVEARPSRLVAQLAGEAVALPVNAAVASAALLPETHLETYEDTSRIAYPLHVVSGGSSILTQQSLCPFRSFTGARLGTHDWDTAQAGLSPRQRGQLLHAVLDRVWSGTHRGGIATHAELVALPDLEAFVRAATAAAMQRSFAPGRHNSLPTRFPARLLELEAIRLTRLVTEWLQYERTRAPFRVAQTEAKTQVTVAGLEFRLRLDRVDHVRDFDTEDEAAVVIDYKSGDLGPSAWRGERPDDLQLPLYAAFGIEGAVEGLAIARVRPGETTICGRVRNASTSLLPDVGKRNGLATDPLSDEQLAEWRATIERLAAEFVAGDAHVDPKDPSKTCKSCTLHSVCRVYEQQGLAASLDEDDTDDSAGDGDA